MRNVNHLIDIPRNTSIVFPQAYYSKWHFNRYYGHLFKSSDYILHSTLIEEIYIL